MYVANILAHGKTMFDKSFVIFTFIRLIEILKFMNGILALCLKNRNQSYHKNVLQRIFDSKMIFTPLLCIFNSDRLWLDVLVLNTVIYNCLFTMETMVQLASPFQDTTHHVIVLCIILCLILGGLSNFMATFITGRPVEDGMTGSLAVCLGYMLQLAPNIPVLNIMHVNFKPGEVLSYVFLTYLTHAMIDSTHGRSLPSTRIITWILGALFGVALYEYQLQIYT